MEGLGTLLLYALFFYLMMRYGCGAHMIHGHHHGGKKSDQSPGGKFIDPVCGKEVEPDQGYGVMNEGNLYRFCSRHCLDQFDGQPSLFTQKQRKEVHHEH
jgi:YHS domain-containing protein